ncbi:HAD family hydrolase [Alicyclobacillus sp.]|uniref:HAD family hydrolase n=1 Tax=Alicyclobacillus sp. TaxID=61169 RepID=UPI0025BDD06C|nr:HAD family hydrolase [Alicyclobacillus sp.]MCL6518041.1 HAD family hydrolase [Alicyclobacillus sp.]
MTGVNITAAGLARLAGCRLFIFDLDGTVYQETDHFRYYGDRILEVIPADARAAFTADVEAALGGRHPALRYGASYDPEHDVFLHDDRPVDWAGRPVEVRPSDRLAHVDDPWAVYMVAGLHHGAAPAAIQEAFLATRRHMEGPEFPMHPLPGLREAIDRLRDHGRRFALATNSPEPDSRRILEKLGLTGAFDAEVFNARKQDRAREHFTRFREAFKVSFEEMVSIGDHYRNEIRPAAELGMATIYIDRYLNRQRPDVTAQVSHPAEVADVLRQVLRHLDRAGSAHPPHGSGHV